MRAERIFGYILRGVFIFAFGAFLSASISHVATFFHNFEPDGTDWTGSYALAFSVDGSALFLTIGMMFFQQNMSRGAKFIIWFFIICLTVFSWIVNWEYAQTFQGDNLRNLDAAWRNINPIMASSFAFLNLAYSLVSESFNTKEKTVEDLQKELDSLTGEKAEILRKIREAKSGEPGLIQRAKNAALEVKKAAAEVMQNSEVQEASTSEEIEQELDENLEEGMPEITQEFDTGDLIQRDLDEEKLPEKLGMIEQMMYEKIMEDPALLFQLQQVAETTDITGLTNYLKNQYNSYANYFTEERVSHVMAAVKSIQSSEEIQQELEVPQAKNLPENYKKGEQVKPQKLEKIGLTFADAAQLPCCKKKAIRASDIKAAVVAGNIVKKSDGSVTKHAVENWAKTYVVSERKVAVNQ